jgi:hypothetical protein
MGKKKNFQMRNFTTLLLTGCSLVMAVSGFVLYIMPEGRIAYWNDWRLLGLDKEQWGALHTILSLAFFFAACVHLYLNWRALVHYLRDRMRRTLTLRRELAAALALTLLLLHGSIAGYAPFSQVMHLGKAAKKSWYAGEDAKPPFAHAELMPLRQLTGKIDVDLPGALAFLTEQGLEADGDSTLKELAAASDRSPSQLFEAMMLDDRLYR